MLIVEEIYRELLMVWDKEFSLRMVCDDSRIVDGWCRAHWDIVRTSIGEHAERNHHLSAEQRSHEEMKTYVVFFTRWYPGRRAVAVVRL